MADRLRTSCRFAICFFLFVARAIRYRLFPWIKLRRRDFALGTRIVVETVVMAPRSFSAPAVYVANHFSFLDYFVLCAYIPGCWAIIRSDLMLPHTRKVRVPWYLKLFDGLIRRDADRARLLLYDKYDTGKGLRGKQVLERTRQLIADGHNVLLFPEGRSQRETKAPREFDSKIFAFASEHGIPVIPMTIAYTPSIGIEAGDSLDMFKLLSTHVKCYVWAEPDPAADETSARDAMIRRLDAFRSMPSTQTQPSTQPSRPYGRALLKTVVSALMFALPLIAMACTPQPHTWEWPLLRLQTCFYICDTFYAVALYDKFQLLHHAIGLSMVLLRAHFSDPRLGPLGILMLFSEQGCGLLHNFNALLGLTYATYERTVPSSLIASWLRAFKIIRTVVFCAVFCGMVAVYGVAAAVPPGIVLVAQFGWQIAATRKIKQQ